MTRKPSRSRLKAREQPQSCNKRFPNKNPPIELGGFLFYSFIQVVSALSSLAGQAVVERDNLSKRP
jgi:hypothetical protein